MTKCFYTESDVTQSASQLLICSISLDGKSEKNQEKHFKRAFPDSWKAAKNLLKYGDNEEINIYDKDDNKPKLGDVIWTQTGGNKHIGYCIVRNHEEENVNKDAVKLCIISAKNKARELKLEYIGMDLFASNGPEEWADIVDIVEDGVEEIQGVVCIPTNDALVSVMDNLPGPKTFRMIK